MTIKNHYAVYWSVSDEGIWGGGGGGWHPWCVCSASWYAGGGGVGGGGGGGTRECTDTGSFHPFIFDAVTWLLTELERVVWVKKIPGYDKAAPNQAIVSWFISNLKMCCLWHPVLHNLLKGHRDLKI